ncbi:RDD family protein, partial [Streptomyces nanhaiensis]|uniref:RDD family protein n=1 Tax=Streptomyces nanhaiensis TaxID=679319 RepID=UPI00399CEAD6
PEQVAPWRPPVDDPFLRAARRQARPAGLGRRLGARLVDGVLTAAVAAAVALPFAGPSAEHFRKQVEAAEQAGETRQIWLVDGTTGVYLAIVLGALFLFGLLYEVLPTARWGRTLGKKLFGVRVLDIEEQDTPSFGAALRRWLVYGLLAPTGIGVVNVLWCLFDRPWRQCWHDKAARTFVARGTEESVPAG